VQRPAALALDEPADRAKHLPRRTRRRPALRACAAGSKGRLLACLISASGTLHRVLGADPQPAPIHARTVRRRALSGAGRRAGADVGLACAGVPAGWLRTDGPRRPAAQRASSWGRDRSGASFPPPNQVVPCSQSRALLGSNATA
jgi:hypothetical protein